jgi:tetrahydromethanopterin S-methyltransferase subunit A
MSLTIKKKLEDGAGRLCKVLFPIKEEYHLGSGRAVAICTLASFDLLETISRSSLMDKVLIAGRLLSENKGIDLMIKFTLNHPELKRIILSGKEVKGHRAGQALLALSHNGVDSAGRIIGAIGPDPRLTLCGRDVEIFRRQVQIIDLRETVDIKKIAQALIT